jgi:hypothetical protein
MLKALQKKKLLESLKSEESLEGENPKEMIDKDFYKQEVVIEGEPLGPTSIREVKEDKKKKK